MTLRSGLTHSVTHHTHTALCARIAAAFCCSSANRHPNLPPKYSTAVSSSELRYQKERAAAESGWNTWLSRDMLTHAILPQGAAVSLELRAGGASLSALGADGPSCDAAKFPAKHGLHAMRGAYTEIEEVSVGGWKFRLESATLGPAQTDLVVVVTTVANLGNASFPSPSLVVNVGIPAAFAPRVCTSTPVAPEDGASLRLACPGFPDLFVSSTNSEAGALATELDLKVSLAPEVGGQVSIQAGLGRPPAISHAKALATVADARQDLIDQFATYGVHNETFAGLQTAISWNVIYTPYEGIVTPVFRGTPWSLAKPHGSSHPIRPMP